MFHQIYLLVDAHGLHTELSSLPLRTISSIPTSGTVSVSPDLGLYAISAIVQCRQANDEISPTVLFVLVGFSAPRLRHKVSTSSGDTKFRGSDCDDDAHSNKHEASDSSSVRARLPDCTTGNKPFRPRKRDPCRHSSRKVPCRNAVLVRANPRLINMGMPAPSSRIKHSSKRRQRRPRMRRTFRALAMCAPPPPTQGLTR